MEVLRDPLVHFPPKRVKKEQDQGVVGEFEFSRISTYDLSARYAASEDISFGNLRHLLREINANHPFEASFGRENEGSAFPAPKIDIGKAGGLNLQTAHDQAPRPRCRGCVIPARLGLQSEVGLADYPSGIKARPPVVPSVRKAKSAGVRPV